MRKAWNRYSFRRDRLGSREPNPGFAKLPPAQAPPNSLAVSAHAGNDSSDELMETPWATVTCKRLAGIRRGLRVITQLY